MINTIQIHHKNREKSNSLQSSNINQTSTISKTDCLQHIFPNNLLKSINVSTKHSRKPIFNESPLLNSK
jgi:hypothetical protein